ncbi:MAG: 3'-5' exonuclease [Clostridiales bacterium]|nr:3'-5' exonuclease [Clostridiales bacterium]
MKYVFFDIECACVFKNVAKICAFGYVVTDEKFNVLEREDILMNPKGKFHLTDRKGKEGLVLPYEYEDFKKYAPFPAAYRRIKELLEQKDAIVLGHATLNDVNYLNLETKRYKLPSFKFEFHDTQFFYMNTEKCFTRQYGLGAMASELGVEFTPHRAVDDAYATMRVCEALCKRENTDVVGLIARYRIRAGKVVNYEIKQAGSAGLKNYIIEKEEQREKHAKAHEQFYRFVNKHNNKKKKGTLEGKVFCFAKDIEDEVTLSIKLLGAIFAAGGKYTSHPAQCNVYIAREEGGVRYQNAIDSGAAFVPLDSLQSALEKV